MIIVKLMGGLGNQMFQYAAGRCLAMRHNTVLKLDTSYLQKDPKNAYTKREFELDVFTISASSKATVAEIESFTKYANNRLYRKLAREFPPFFSKVYIAESGHAYDKKFKAYPADTYLDGYWQSEKYFEEESELIHNEFTFKSQPTELNSNLIEKIKKENSVSLHIRRADYTANKEINAYHGVCDISYYKQAVDLISSGKEMIRLYIFSDDVQWCKQNLSFNFPCTYIEHNKAEKSFEDMRLMSFCKHNIIANSSFSWWAAWLNTNKDKQVIAPKNWFQTTKNPDIYPESWIQL